MTPSEAALLREAAERAIEYLEGIDRRQAPPSGRTDLSRLGGPLPSSGSDPRTVLTTLADTVGPETMAMAGPRFFGWVIGGSHPVAVAADWLTSAWDQNTVWAEATPGTVAVEAAAVAWVREACGLPAGAWGAFTTGTTSANLMALGAAITSVLDDVGWNAVDHGLFGAPPVTVVVGEEVHPSLRKALGLTGLGRERVIRVPVDDQGRMRADALPTLTRPAIVCLQAGNVNTGAFDPMSELIPAAKAQGAWVHVDGAFGLWAGASPEFAHLTVGIDEADSWATDAHKYLNVPYDAGVVLVREPSALERVATFSASYLPDGEIGRDPALYTMELSRRARGIPTWAVLKTLGSEGVASLVERTCALARRFATRLTEAGFEVLNDVVLNQVLVSFGDDERTSRVVSAVQEEGSLFVGPTVWQGRTAMRLSVSSWKTTAADVDCSVEVILACAREA